MKVLFPQELMRNYWIISLAMVALAGQFTLAIGMPGYSGLQKGNGGIRFPDCCCVLAANACCGTTCQCTPTLGTLDTGAVNEEGKIDNWEIQWLNPVNHFQCQGGIPFTLPGCELFIQKSNGLEFYFSESAASLQPLLTFQPVLHLVDPPPPRR